MSFKVIDFGVNLKRIYNFLLFINSNFGRISSSFRDIDTLSYKIACFPQLIIVRHRLAEESHALSA